MKKFCIPTKMISGSHFALYVIIGLWNTVFGYVVYAFFTYVIDGYNIRFSYIYAYILSNIVSITQAFITHKYIVFRSKGNFWAEYKRCWIVYGSTLLFSSLLLPIFVNASSILLPEKYKIYDKYIGGIIITGIAAFISFIGHQKVTFCKK